MRSKKKKSTLLISDKALAVKPFIVMDVLEKAKEMESRGEDIIHLEIGEPDFDTPEIVKEAAAKALSEGYTHYTHSQGLLELREEISRYYYDNYKVDITPDRIIVTSGTSPVMQMVFSALLNPGDEIILSDPYYSCYPNFIQYADGVPVTVKVYEENGFRFSVDGINARCTPRTRAILINSPSNPTGNVLPPEDLEALANLGIPVVSDEIYHGLVYRERAHSMLEFTDNTIVINGFSKLFAMTGWRLGYAIVPEEMVRSVRNMQQNLAICAGSFVQRAAITALKHCKQHTEDMCREYDRRRVYTLDRLNRMGLGITVPPTGAFYTLANVKHISMDSYALAFDILEKAKVAVSPGIDFGPNAEGYLRISYANSIGNIAEGMDRLEDYLASVRQP